MDTSAKTAEDLYYQQLSRDIEFILYYKTDDFNAIVKELGSVDITAATEIYNKLIVNQSQIKEFRMNFLSKILDVRRRTSQFIYNLPSPNSMYSQWWFSINTIERIAFKIRRCSGKNRVAFLGAPTVAFFYKKCFDSNVVAFDVDPDIVQMLESDHIESLNIDILAEQISHDYCKCFKSVFMDPPWYDNAIHQFISQAAQIVEDHGYIFASIPSPLTRPGIVESRQEYIKYIQQMNLQLLSIDSNYFEYSIPVFENVVLRNTAANIDREWRKSDLLVIKSTEEASPQFMKIISSKILSFHLVSDTKLRVFLKENMDSPKQTTYFSLIKEFSEDISTRKNLHDKVHMWTSNQVGYSVKYFDLAKGMLSMWGEGKDLETVAGKLEPTYPGVTRELRLINDATFLWKDNETVCRRTPELMIKSTTSSPLSAQNSTRRIEQKGDGFRLEFQRDRDRIVWSESFRKLANKCQVFSFDNDEINPVRTRLTHSIEVMQLASTIGNSFGLNKDLIEAGSLCHDIGHTPFGHGGEFTLNNILNDINENLGGFNHYEHGLDVVEFIEHPYLSGASGGFNGLNLMPETLECILKHTYTKKDQDSVYKKSKYKEVINNNYGSLESQTVRIADKISYMLSDIEDGAKMGIIRYNDVMKCRLFSKAPIDMNPLTLDNTSNSFYNLLISQRRAIVKIIMEDVLTTSEKQIATIKSIDEVKDADGYLIQFSSDIKDCMNEIWEKLQAGLLHKDSRVEAANFRAAQIISSLFYLYAFSPELIDNTFRQRHKLLKDTTYIKSVEGKLGKKIGIAKQKVANLNFNLLIGKKIESEGDNYKIPTCNVILAKDYVASLTDRRAIKEYHAHFGFTK